MPAIILKISSVVSPFDQENVYVPAGVTLRSMAPLLRSQEAGVTFVLVDGSTTLVVTVKASLEVHPPISVTVTE